MKKFKPRALALTLAAAVGLTCFSAAPAMAATGGVEPEQYTGIVKAPEYVDVINALNLANSYRQGRINPSADSPFWDKASYYTGNMEAYYTTGNEKYRKYSTAWAEANNWEGNNADIDPSLWWWSYNEGQNSYNVIFGDWQICFQTFIDLYNSERMEERTDGDERKLKRAKYVIDEQIKINPAENPQRGGNGFWWWADSLYMVPPVFAKLYATTGDITYIDKLYEYYQYAAELMYDGPNGIPTSEEGYKTKANLDRKSNTLSDPDDYKYLFFRDASYVWPEYPINAERGETKPEIANTVKNFWARGNGWVFAGLAKILPEIPESHKSYAYLLNIYKQMAAAIVKWQRTDDAGRGFWTQSMLQNYPTSDSNKYGYETSGTAFFTYGLAWGLNSGILDESYRQPTYRAWKYLAEVALQPNGLVGYCQPIGSNATEATPQSTDQAFGYGAFLLAASEVSRLVGGVQGDVVDGEPNGDIYPYLLHKMVGKTAFELGSPHLFRDGKILHIDDTNYGVTPYKEGNEVYLPAGAIEKLGLTGVAANGSGYVTGSALETAGYSLWPFPYGGERDGLGDLYVISKTSEFLYECDKNAVDMLRSMIGRVESYPVRPEQETVPEPDVRELPYGEKVTLDVSMATASNYQNENNEYHPGSHAVDENLNTKWAVDGQATLQIDLGREMPISCVGIYVADYSSDGRSIYYKIGFGTSSTTYTYATSNYVTSTPGGNCCDYTDINGQIARYIQIAVNGNTLNNNDWSSILEVYIYTGTPEISKPNVEKLTVTKDMLSATAEQQSENPLQNILDDNVNTVWAAQNKQYLTVDLGEAKNIAYIKIRPGVYTDKRKVNYQILYSINNADFTTLFDGQSQENGGKYEFHELNDYARYISICLNESTNTENGGWASLADVEIYAYPEEDSSVTPQETGTIKSELNYVAAAADAAGAAENDLAILFTGKDIPAGAHYEIADAKGTVIYKDEPDPAAGTDLAVTVVPTDTNALYTASVIANTGEVLAAADASVYSVLAENLNMHATTDYSAADVRFNPARIANAVEALSHGGVFVGPTGAVTDELKLITTAETSGTTTTYTLLPEIVKMGIVFKSDGSNIYYGSGETAFTDSGIFDTIKVDNTTDGLSVTLSQSDGFPGAEAADISLSIPEEGGELH